jgi:hypothetical protein
MPENEAPVLYARLLERAVENVMWAITVGEEHMAEDALAAMVYLLERLSEQEPDA